MKPNFKTQKLFVAAIAATTFISFNLPQEAQAAKGKRSVKGGSWIDLQVSTDKLNYVEGEKIKVTLKATNIQEKDAYLKFTSGQRFDFNLFKDGSKEAIYTWSANKMFTMALATVKLKMAERETYNTEIGGEMGELKAGKYRLVAHLTNSTQIKGLPIDFTIAPKMASATDKRATLTANTDKKVYKAGETMKVDFKLTNNPDKATTFTFRNGQNYDVFVKNAAGKTVWNWSHGKAFLMIYRPVTLKAGEVLEFSADWEGKGNDGEAVAPGKYTVQAVYESNPPVTAPTMSIEIQ